MKYRKSLYLIRGVSGSGKTTTGKNIAEVLNCNLFEADQYFEVDGVYKFDATQLNKAHNWCLNNVATEIREGRNVVVSNTFTREWEFQEYVRCALLHDFRVVIIECLGHYQNTHGLTETQIARQTARFESNDEIKAKNSRYDDNRVIFLQAPVSI
jgi:predicted kinase